jgi:Nif-specific regulatory protein
LVDVALALAGSGAWDERFAAAVQALRPVLGWRRAVLARSRGGLAVRGDSLGPRALASDDVALRFETGGPTQVTLASSHGGHDPVHLMLGARAALVAPLASGGALIFEIPESVGPEALALAVEAARLVSPRLSEETDSTDEPEAEHAFPEIVGRCPALTGLFSELERIAISEAFVHIAGETGTGKGKVALALHRRSRRRQARFVAVNAASLSDELFEAELFGHARGAFTGAVNARDGYVAEAEGGTLFLDEVADLSPRSQAKLLRLLQEREYRRVGESETRRADVRVISAANADLRARVREGRFREDLLFRLNVLSVRLPPLRDRGADVLILARHFLRLAAARDVRPVPSLAPAVARALERYGWPGNVRELENEMARLVALAAGEPLRPEWLSPRVLEAGGLQAPGTRLREALVHFERGVLRSALDRRSGNRLRTAEDLGISRQALLGKMGRLGVR